MKFNEFPGYPEYVKTFKWFITDTKIIMIKNSNDNDQVAIMITCNNQMTIRQESIKIIIILNCTRKIFILQLIAMKKVSGLINSYEQEYLLLSQIYLMMINHH
jgi:hypothetical protein